MNNKTGPLALIGGEEFADGFEAVHARIREEAERHGGMNGRDPRRAVFLPSCAAEDGLERVNYWCELARQRLGDLGVKVKVPLVIDPQSAHDPENVRQVAEAGWIYIGGGYPHVGMRVLDGTPLLKALLAAWEDGALVTGASGGAMLMCGQSWVITPEFDEAASQYWSQENTDWELPLPPPLRCLGMVPRSLCWPHLNQLFSARWLGSGLLPQGYLFIGLDEQTAVVRSGRDGWEVMGKGRAVVGTDARRLEVYTAGMKLGVENG